MRIGIDARMLAHSGIGTYLQGLLDGLARAGGEHQYVVFTLAHLASRVPESAGFEVISSPVSVYSPREHLDWRQRLARAGCDLYHVPHYNVPLGFGRPYVVTVHDLIPILFPEPGVPVWRQAAARLLLTHAVRRAARVVAVSRCTADDLQTRLGVEAERVDVVTPGIHPRYRPMPAPAVEAFRSRSALPQRFILWVGLRRPHKNVERLVRAYARYRTSAQSATPSLVLWGMPNARDAAVEAAIAELGLSQVVHSVDRRIAADEMPLLYGAASAFVMPSLYEGFGLPPLEAAACGVPVLAARAGSLPEVLGGAAVWFDPHDVEALAQGLARIIDDPTLRAALRQQGVARAAEFPWNATADAMRATYERATGRGHDGSKHFAARRR